MTLSFSIALLGHIILGVFAVAGIYAVWMLSLKKEINANKLKTYSASSFIFLILSWLAGAYYYLYYYGKSARSLILNGPYPWAHKIIMEAKEHIFLFLPYLLAVAVVVIFAFGQDLNSYPKTRRSMIYLAALMTIIGIAITLAGPAISGAVRR